MSESPEAPQSPETPGMVAARPQILLVDDEPDIVALLSLVLEQEGYQPMVCRSGAEALEALYRGERPAAVVLDLMLPEMSGFQLCRLLKSRADLRQIPVLILTACTQPVDHFRAEDCGADAYMTKPFDIAQVVHAVGRLTGSPRAVQDDSATPRR